MRKIYLIKSEALIGQFLFCMFLVKECLGAKLCKKANIQPSLTNHSQTQ